MPVAPTAPGLFALLEDGLRAIVVNQDGSLNGPENPAQAGQVVVMYGTGEGQTNPPGIDGRLAPYPGPELTHPVRVTIGGADAAITFAGPAPGFAGLLQVNAVVPDGIVFGPRVPLELQIGPASSRRGLVLSVRGVEPLPDFGGTLLQPGVPTPFSFPAIQYGLFAGEYSYAVDVPIGVKSLTLTMVPDTPVWDAVFGFRTGRPLEYIGDWEQVVRVQPNTPIVIESPVAGRLFIQAFRAFDFGTGLHTSKEILSGKLTVTFE